MPKPKTRACLIEHHRNMPALRLGMAPGYLINLVMQLYQ